MGVFEALTALAKPAMARAIIWVVRELQWYQCPLMELDHFVEQQEEYGGWMVVQNH